MVYFQMILSFFENCHESENTPLRHCLLSDIINQYLLSTPISKRFFRDITLEQSPKKRREKREERKNEEYYMILIF
jgi:hypothetical protein